MTSPGTLFVVATPIGNLGDLSTRAREVLASVDLIAAEDTRRSGRLLAAAGIEARMTAVHEHNEAEKSAALVADLCAGRSIALISDAGTPLISDPGFRLVRAARASGITVSPVPGASALTAALSVAGLPTDRFAFEGFLPKRAEKRRARLVGLKLERRTLIFYLAKHDATDTLRDLVSVFGGERPATLARELTKIHEQVTSGTLATLLDRWETDEDARRGELVLVVGGYEGPDNDRDLDQVLGVLLDGHSTREAAALAARLCGVPRREAYRRALELTHALGVD